ncbi:salivary peroxidase/catechol oxidase-like [Babylonia areolata]|uniref:salivary peroxidase/catechol oxidase-like n=1 Tax=Babylonia areolata TaxID=304850 RepID=UPI003FD33745
MRCRWQKTGAELCTGDTSLVGRQALSPFMSGHGKEGEDHGRSLTGGNDRGSFVWARFTAGTVDAEAIETVEDGVGIDMDAVQKDLAQRSSETDGGDIEGENLRKSVQQIKEYKEAIRVQCERSRFYAIDGKCNNLKHPFWGAAFFPLVRDLPNAYTDGKLVPRLYAQGTNDSEQLPSARLVTSRCMSPVDTERPRDLHPSHSQNFMQFGQYFSHDLALTPILKGLGCCEGLDENGLHPDTFTGGPCFPIIIPYEDRHFHYCMVFNRSVYEIDRSGVAQQLTSATHVIDQSTVYGSTEKFANSIRTFKDGKLRTDHYGMLPQDNKHKCFLHKPLNGCPVAGDNRLSVFPGLTTTHLIFHLEHNRVAEALRGGHPGWDDERLYQEARAIMIAETQNLVYREYLPLVLGRKLMRFFGLRKRASYDPNVNPSIINAFQTAAFRFGHSQINNIFVLNPYTGQNVSLNNTYFRPYMLFYKGKPIFGDLMLSLMTHRGQKVDPEFAFGVLDDLFLGVDAPGHSSDLVARSIQRARDHGLAGYLAYLDKALRVLNNDTLINDITLPSCAAGLYRSVEDIDLFLGGIYEDHVPGGEVGPVFGYLIGQQFKNLREGDRLFFDTKGSDAGFTRAQIRSIKKTKYSGIICRNTGLKRVPRNAFKIPHPKRNPMVDCASIPDVKFSLW